MTLIIMALWALGIALLIGVAVHRGRLPSKQPVSRLAEPPKGDVSLNLGSINLDELFSPRDHLSGGKQYRPDGAITNYRVDKRPFSGLAGGKPKEKSKHSGSKVTKPLAR